MVERLRSFRKTYTACIGVLVLATIGACTTSPPAPGKFQIDSSDLWIESRSVRIPATLVVPRPVPKKLPLVLLIHGHGGTRHEAGGFTAVAQGLAEAGIASIRVDFPGCGDSTESFTKNNLTNMLQDIAAAQRYAEQRLPIDSERLGLLGFSMGGRLAIERVTSEANYKAMALWAPSAIDGEANMTHYLGGVEAYKRLKMQAKTEGFAPFTTSWGQQQQLGLRWFTDIEHSTPTVDIREYEGALFVLYGDQDTVVKPEISEQLIRAAQMADPIVRQIVPGADHGLGFFNDDTVSANETIHQTVRFLTAQLRKH